MSSSFSAEEIVDSLSEMNKDTLISRVVDRRDATVLRRRLRSGIAPSDGPRDALVGRASDLVAEHGRAQVLVQGIRDARVHAAREQDREEEPAGRTIRTAHGW